MVGGMEVHKNKFVEDWATNRENLEYKFRFNRRTLPICVTFGLVVPLLTYYGIVAEFVSAKTVFWLFFYAILVLSSCDFASMRTSVHLRNRALNPYGSLFWLSYLDPMNILAES
jgi:hypothetical protein